jgi:hypothetical protein
VLNLLRPSELVYSTRSCLACRWVPRFALRLILVEMLQEKGLGEIAITAEHTRHSSASISNLNRMSSLRLRLRAAGGLARRIRRG